MPLLVPLFALLALTAAFAIPIIVCMRSVREGGWTRLVRVFLVMAAAAFLTCIACGLRLHYWKLQQNVQNRINVCALHDNLTALLDIGDEKMTREFVEEFYTNGCTLLSFEAMHLDKCPAEAKDFYSKWDARIRERKADRKAETK